MLFLVVQDIVREALGNSAQGELRLGDIIIIRSTHTESIVLLQKTSNAK